jgi:hypothetical protein
VAAGDPRSRSHRTGTPATQPSPLKGQNRAVMLREGRSTGAHRSGGRLWPRLSEKTLFCFCIFLLKWYLQSGSGQAAPAREFLASEAPASLSQPFAKYMGTVALREGRLTDAHRSGDRLSRQPLGAHNVKGVSI